MSVWVQKWEVDGSNGKTWIVSRDVDFNFGCSCPVWKFKRAECKHIKKIMAEQGLTGQVLERNMNKETKLTPPSYRVSDEELERMRKETLARIVSKKKLREEKKLIKNVLEKKPDLSLVEKWLKEFTGRGYELEDITPELIARLAAGEEVKPKPEPKPEQKPEIPNLNKPRRKFDFD